MKIFLTTMRNTGLKYRRFSIFFVFSALVLNAARLASNILSGELSEAVTAESLDMIFELMILITGVVVVRIFFGSLQTLYQGRFAAASSYSLRERFMKNFLRAPFAKVEDSGTGESLSIYTNDLPPSAELVSNSVFKLIDDFIMFIGALILLITISPGYTGISLAMAAAVMVVVLFISIPIQKLTAITSEKQADFNAAVNDFLQNLSTIATYSLDRVVESRYMAKYREYFAVIRKLAVAIVVMIFVSFLTMFGPLIAIFTVLGLAVINGHIELSDFVTFALTVVGFAGSVMMMAQNIGDLRQALGRAKRFNDYTNHAPEDENANSEAVPDSAVGIEFKNVKFIYEIPEKEEKKKSGITIKTGKEIHREVKAEEPAKTVVALDDVSLSIKPGSHVAVVGGSGSGKSTMLKLLLGLYDPAEGEILINGISTKSMAKSSLRNIFAYVPQDSFLFPYSIGKNITLEDEISNVKRLETACRDAGILEFINSLPEKFDGILNESADNVSGGQRQRIAIARAFYKNAPAILLDEATSALDPTTEAAVLDTFNRASHDKTAIMIAHRPQAIEICDTIIVMDGGKIAGIGTHKELLASNDVYKKLYGVGL